MYYLSMILIALCSNIDNLVVGIAMGIKNLKITAIGNLIIASLSFMGTYLSMTLGKICIYFINNSIANSAGGIFLIAIGLHGFISSFKKTTPDENKHNIEMLSYNDYMENPEKADINKSGFIDLKESIILGTALSINNIGVGFGAGISKFNILFTSIFAFVFSLITISLGFNIGKQLFSKTIEKYANTVSSCIIMLLGLSELLIK